MTPAASGRTVHASRPANANRIQPARPTISRPWTFASDRSFSVVVLVLVTVVAGIVVLVPGEIDFIEHHRGVLRPRLHHCFNRALGQAAARHLGADDKGDSRHERRE